MNSEYEVNVPSVLGKSEKFLSDTLKSEGVEEQRD